jgi:hypothetical protein
MFGENISWEKSFTTFGVILIWIGIILVLVPLIIKLLPTVDLNNIPWILLYVYKKDGFFFVTSPILILITVVYLLWAFLRQ